MSGKHIARIANLLSMSIDEATIYCEEVRRASGFGTQLSYQTIARHLRGKKAPFPKPDVLASIIKQQESFRIKTGNRFPAKRLPNENSPSKNSQPNKAYTAPGRGRSAKKTPETPLLDGIEIQSRELIRELKRRVIDEHGFLVSTDLIPKTQAEDTSSKHFRKTDSSRPVTQANIFESIKSLDSNIPGARIKRLRPKPDQEVLCPVCHKHLEYQILFDHVGSRHPEKNAKFVLARFNRDYEIWAKSQLNKK